MGGLESGSLMPGHVAAPHMTTSASAGFCPSPPEKSGDRLVGTRLVQEPLITSLPLSINFEQGAILYPFEIFLVILGAPL